MIDFDYQKLGAGYYDRIFEKHGGMRRFWHEAKFEKIESHLELKPGMRLLDAGCAAGSFLGRSRMPFAEAVGVDISEAQIRYAKSTYPDPRIRFVAADILKFEPDGPLFDRIVLSEVLEHLSRARALEVLKRLKSFLSPGGRLVVTTPNYRSLWPALEFVVNRLSPVSYEHQHINRLDREAFGKHLKEAGFAVEKMQTFFLTGPFLSLLSYSLARRFSAFESRILPWAGCILIASAKAA